MSKRRLPGEYVRLTEEVQKELWALPFSHLRLTTPEDGEFHDVSGPCLRCGDPECREWANVWIVYADRQPVYTGSADARVPMSLSHVSECQMMDWRKEPKEEAAADAAS